MAKSKSVPEISEVPTSSELTKAFVEAIELTRPVAKKTIATRKKNTPWTPKDGSPRLKLKRKMYHHDLLIDSERVSNEEIDLLNKIKPGVYCDGWVRVIRRKDRGINIDYSVKTSHKLKLVTEFNITSFSGLLQRCIEEAKNPQKLEAEEVED